MYYLTISRALCHGSKEGSTNMVYRCRLCPYSTSQMDNLRKHVLKTTKHPGGKVICFQFTIIFISIFLCNKQQVYMSFDFTNFFSPSNVESMYQCLWCEYRCNLQLDFRSHILKFHPQEDAENTINEYFSMKPTTSK